MSLFVRSVVLAVAFSVAGLSSALVICVTGCTDGPAADLSVEQVVPPCHDSEPPARRTIGNGPAVCAHKPTSLIAGALTFDMRPSFVTSPSIASLTPALAMVSYEWTMSLTTSRTLVAQRPSATLRI